MTILPQNNYVLCKQLNQTKHEDLASKIIYEKEELPIYEIIDIGKNLNDFRFNIGDSVICCSTGTKLKIEKDIYFLFDEKNIVGKIL